jgi:hypothetical protein
VATKNIYVRPKDVLRIHVIDDVEASATKTGWEEFLKNRSSTCPPEPFSFIIRGRGSLEVITSMTDVYGGRQQGKYTEPNK